MGGKMSPDEAWRMLQPRDSAGVIPLCKLPADCQYLLATHVRRVRIGRNGIRLPDSLGGGTYQSETTGRLQWREVNIYFDPELPETISIVSDDRQQVFTVPRAPTCPAHDATPEEIAAAQASVSSHTRYARQRISQLRHEYMPPVRANIVDPRTAEIGREMKAQQEKLQVRQEAKRRRESRIRNMARSLRLNPAAVVNARGLEHLKKGLSDD